MIADGHHRYTTALAFRDEMHAAQGAGPWDALLMLLVDAAEEPPVLPFHRLVAAASPSPDGTRVAHLAALLGQLDDADLVVGSIRMEGGVLVHRVVHLAGEPPAVATLEPLLPPSEADEIGRAHV